MQNNEVLWAKMCKTAIIPTKRDEDAGFDIYASDRSKDIIIQPHQTTKIYTGICSAFDKSKVAIIKERSSTGTKGIGQRAGVIDSGYRGEWIIALTNHNDKPILITKDIENADKEKYIVYDSQKAICQVIFLELPQIDSKEVTVEQIKKIPSERKDGKLGSSKK